MSRKLLKYPEKSMLDALEEVKRGVSYKTAAERFGVPRVTLMNKHKGQTPLERKMGTKTYFTQEQEVRLVDWIKEMAKAGFPLHKDTFLYSVCKLAKELNIKFKHDMPSSKWYKGFMERHNSVRARVYQNLTSARKSVTKDNIEHWFCEVKQYIDEKGLQDVLRDPSRVFNTDETAFYLNPKLGKVLAPKGSKTVYLGGANDEKENVTTLIAANADGKFAPPMVVYKYQRVPLYIAEAVPPQWAIGRSDSGWMTHELFYEFMANIFYPWVVEHKIGFPIIFFLDRHTSHLSLPLSQFCIAKEIHLIALYPNATHILQPMDVAVFYSLKSEWRKLIQTWRLENNMHQLNKKDFAPLLKKVLTKISPIIIQNGFKKCGLVPWNSAAVSLPFHPESKNKARALTASEEADLKKFFTSLENKIGEEKLLIFIRNKGAWSGKLEDTSLYYIWKRIKCKVDGLQNAQTPISHFAQPSTSNQTGDSLFRESTDEGVTEHSELLRESTEKSVNDEFVKDSTDGVDKYSEVLEESTEEGVNDNSEHQHLKEITEEGVNEPSEVIRESTEERIKEHPKADDERSDEAEIYSSRVMQTIPSPFKKTLFYPLMSKPVKKMKREKIPSVLTSPQAIAYYKKKQDKKNGILQKKMVNKKKREEKKKLAEKEKVKKIKRKKPEENDTTSTETSLHFAESDESDLNDWMMEDEEAVQAVSENDYKKGNFILSVFLGGKRNKSKFIYLCLILEIKSNVEVMVLKSKGINKKVFVLDSERVSISFEEIVGKVDHPQVIDGGDNKEYIFKKPLPVREKFDGFKCFY